MATVIKNYKQLERAMNKVIQESLGFTSRYVNQVVTAFLQQWYDEYDPAVDIRTYQLLHSCTVGRIRKRGKNKYDVQIYIDYGKMHHMSYKNELDKNGKPIPNRPKTKQQELVVVRMADGRNLINGNPLGNDAMMQRGLGKMGRLNENVVFPYKDGRRGTRFWTDAMTALMPDSPEYSRSEIGGVAANTKELLDKFYEFLVSRGFDVIAVNTDNYTLEEF